VNRLPPSAIRVLAALASGGLLAASFPRSNRGYLAWVALVPLLLAVRGRPLRAAAGYGWLTGAAFFLATLYWIPDTISNFTTISPVVATGLWVLLAIVAAYFHAGFAAGVEWLAAGGISRLAAAPLLWVVLEWVRTWFIAAFPWNSLGYSQVWFGPLPQFADIGGVYGLSAVLVLASAALAEMAAALGERADAGSTGARTSTETRRAALFLAIAVACPVGLFAYGKARLAWIDSIPATGQIRVGIVQGNIAQDQKWDVALQDRILAGYLALSEEAADAGARLVVWPEAALPFSLRDPRARALVDLARRRGIDLLIGVPGYDSRDGGDPQPYNQAWLVEADGQFQGPYDKIQLVPFGEYIPLRGLFGMVDIAVQAVGEFGRGTEHTIFEGPRYDAPGGGIARAGGQGEAGAAGVAGAVATPADARGDNDPTRSAGRPSRFAALICYEGIFPSLTREFATAGAEFLVNISNDAWYGDTSAPDQHLTMAALRSIENRLPMVRSTNTGISAFVTDKGRIGPRTRLFEEEVMVETVLVRDVWSFYRAFGDVFLYACMGLFTLLVVVRFRRA